jgi:hypothetical protein
MEGIDWLNIITVVVPQIITVATVVTRVTPTDADNKVLDFVLKFIDAVATLKKPS